jgi:hypothetical protein
VLQEKSRMRDTSLLSVRDERAVMGKQENYVPFSNKLVLHGQSGQIFGQQAMEIYVLCHNLC